MIDAWLWRQEERYKKEVTLAWLAEGLARQKRLPSLKNYLSGGKDLTKREKVEAKADFELLKKEMENRLEDQRRRMRKKDASRN